MTLDHLVAWKARGATADDPVSPDERKLIGREPREDRPRRDVMNRLRRDDHVERAELIELQLERDRRTARTRAAVG